MLAMLNIFKSSPTGRPIDKSKIDSVYKYWRIHILATMYLGYAVFYFTRKSISFAAPQMIEDLPGIGKPEIGILLTLFYLIYGTSKFLSGIISDNSNPRYFMGIGLIATGICNILFGLSSSFMLLALFWGLNSFFQGWGWPPCSKLLTTWYSRSERGFWWSIWNTAHNLGGALIPLIVGAVSLRYGWRYGFITPGIIAVATGCFLCWHLRDKPTSIGLPTVGKWRNDELELEHENNSEQISIINIFTKYILKNKVIWMLCLSSVLVYIVRTAINDWGNLYLKEKYGYDLLTANSAVSLFEMGGFIGSLVAGWGSDRLFNGRRDTMNLIFSVGILLSFTLLWQIDNGDYFIQSALFFAAGFFIFGPQMLLGMAAAESSHKDVAGTATGFLGLFAYLGASLSGYPLTQIMEKWHWDGFMVLMVSSATMCVMVLFYVAMLQKPTKIKDKKPL